MKIGYVQCDIHLKDKKFNLKKFDKYLSSMGDIDIVVLPELCNVGYVFENRDDLMKESEEIHDSPTIDFFRNHARNLNALIVAGFAERQFDDIYNSSVAVYPDGRIEIYRKVHLFDREKELFKAGDKGFSVFDFRGVKVSMIICFDWCFPETWRTLSLKGVQIVCMSANLVLPGRAQRAVPVMCMMNCIYTICANRIGKEADLSFTGRSIIANPGGEIICESPSDKEEYRMVEIDPQISLNKWITSRNNIFQDRRPEFYET
ncbi:MAG: hypothetical protein A2161_16350 [Candidatus Schekmanbacteria bacterium RBG_13_48_7]|uniref:CN hydrolase domain-containing protein n=1 Tax=Candidatus Schekmanbacteria bacterium RBG_13_48_7 TaxID=1817878 RepID=A0A1F7S3U4_9BACT|nr:MAG: hypothetical protein A2161_16350 [Candidatus Schekmanbacteria bacterium RBG_13_48_7]